MQLQFFEPACRKSGALNKNPREVCEHALAHNIMVAMEAAYARTTFVEQRRCLVQDWSNFFKLPAG